MMTFQEQYEEYRSDMATAYNENPSIKRVNSYLEKLKNILKNADLWNKDITVSEDLSDIRRALRPWILKYFDDREEIIYVINNFFESFSEIWATERESRICLPDKLYERNELNVKILKYLQSGEDEQKRLTREDIADHFGMSINALEAHLRELTGPDCQIFGTNVRIDLRRGRNTYDSTIHPVFMALNLSEVYFLTVILPTLAENTQYKEIAFNISSDIFRQLSPYAKDIIRPHAEKHRLSFNADPPQYRREEKNIVYFEKSGARCRILYSNLTEPLLGRFIFEKKANFETDDGQKLQLDYHQIMEISFADR